MKKFSFAFALSILAAPAFAQPLIQAEEINSNATHTTSSLHTCVIEQDGFLRDDRTDGGAPEGTHHSVHQTKNLTPANVNELKNLAKAAAGGNYAATKSPCAGHTLTVSAFDENTGAAFDLHHEETCNLTYVNTSAAASTLARIAEQYCEMNPPQPLD